VRRLNDAFGRLVRPPHVVPPQVVGHHQDYVGGLVVLLLGITTTRDDEGEGEGLQDAPREPWRRPPSHHDGAAKVIYCTCCGWGGTRGVVGGFVGFSSSSL
jgi:hypothetical protein